MQSQRFTVDIGSRLTMKIFHMRWLVNFQNEIGTDDRVAAKPSLHLRLIEENAAQNAIFEAARRGKIDKSGHDVEMTPSDRGRMRHMIEHFGSVKHQRHAETFVQGVSRTRGDVLLSRIMIAGNCKNSVVEFRIRVCNKITDTFIRIPK